MNKLVALATRLGCVRRQHQVYVGDLSRATVLMVLANAVLRYHGSSELMSLEEAQSLVSQRLDRAQQGLVMTEESVLYFEYIRGLRFNVNVESDTILSSLAFDILYPMTAQSVISRYRITRWGERWNRWMEAYGRSLGDGEWGPYIWPM